MLDPEFAYSNLMQIILFFTTCLITIIAFWFTTTVILTIYGEKVSIKQRIYFILIAGIILSPLWTYFVYIIGGLVRFSPWLYKLVTIPNPIVALLYYFIGVKTLKLSGYRLIHLMRHVYLYWMIVQVAFQITGHAFFPQTEIYYNYLIDTYNVISNILIILIVNNIIIKWLKQSHILIRLMNDNQPHSIFYELVISFIQALVIYLIVLFIPYISNETTFSYILLCVILVLWLINSVLIDSQKSTNIELENKNVYINTLIRSIDSFSGIKHDFYNILQTYSGYLALNNLDGLKKYHEKLLSTTIFAGDQIDLGKRMNENPVLISLIMEKQKQAKHNDIFLRTTILCSIDDLLISEIDLCRILVSLLDNAIDAATSSNKKHVSFSIEQKVDNSKLIIISNSTKDEINLNNITISGFTTKDGHLGLGIPKSRNLLRKYPQCSLQFSYYNYEFSVYLEVR